MKRFFSISLSALNITIVLCAVLALCILLAVPMIPEIGEGTISFGDGGITLNEARHSGVGWWLLAFLAIWLALMITVLALLFAFAVTVLSLVLVAACLILAAALLVLPVMLPIGLIIWLSGRKSKTPTPPAPPANATPAVA
jgi:hypothetical protein